MKNSISDDIAQNHIDRLRYLHDVAGIDWRNIAKRSPYQDIPPGTLWSIARQGVIPNKWRRVLDLPELKPTPACPTCGEVPLADHCPTCDHTKRPKQRNYKDLYAIPPAKLKKALDGRYEAYMDKQDMAVVDEWIEDNFGGNKYNE